eukprot:PhF_6_TR7222/c0_g1_i1/m.10791
MNIPTAKWMICGFAMHHIYAESKKESITTHANLLNLRGVYVYGKPGRVVVEGSSLHVPQYERKIIKLRWQECKVQCRYTHDCEMGYFEADMDQGMMKELDSVKELEAWLENRGLKCVAEDLRRPFHMPLGPSIVLPLHSP